MGLVWSGGVGWGEFGGKRSVIMVGLGWGGRHRFFFFSYFANIKIFQNIGQFAKIVIFLYDKLEHDNYFEKFSNMTI